MKLIDLLVQELPNRGGWPELATCAAQDNDELVMFADCDPSIVRQINGRWFMNSRRLNGNGIEGYKLADDYATSVITREQYEAALTAAQQPVWDGEGLPPVGCECEVQYWNDGLNEKVIILAYHGDEAWVKFSECKGKTALIGNPQFRPIRSEADKKRDMSLKQMSHSLKANGSITDEQLNRLYDDIATGKIPGLKLDV